MRIGIDIDGVVADFVGAANKWFSVKSNHPPIPADCWDWYLKYPGGVELGDRLFVDAVNEGLYLRCKPVPGALDALYVLRKANHDLTFITYRKGATAEKDTRAWLKRWHYGDVPVVFTKDKGEVPWELHLDDHPETVVDLRSRGRSAVLFAQPWNEQLQNRVPTVRGWGDFLTRLDGWVAA